MKEVIFKADNSYGPLILRVMLGSVVFAHGAQKLLGWFGGFGFTGTMDFFTNTMGLPWLIGFLVIILESVGALALIAGIATRLLAVAFTFLALGIMFSVHTKFGFFMNWFGSQGGEGMEYFLLWIGMAAGLIFLGSGRYSIDRYILRN